MKFGRRNRATWLVSLLVLPACARDARLKPADNPVEAMAGIYEVTSRVENADACSVEGAKPKPHKSDHFFFVAPDRGPQPFSKELQSVGMIASCESLEACKEAAGLYLSDEAMRYSYGGSMKLTADGTLQQTDEVPRTTMNERQEGVCDMVWTQSTVTAEGTNVTYREEDHFAKFAEPEGHEACHVQALERAPKEPCGRVRVTVGKRVGDLPEATKKAGGATPAK